MTPNKEKKKKMFWTQFQNLMTMELLSGCFKIVKF